MSEVGVSKRKEEEDLNNNIDIFPEYFMKDSGNINATNGSSSGNDSSSNTQSNYKGLQVSDQPLGVGRRQRRNSAGDEISSILNHEAFSPGSYGTGGGLVVMNSPLATSETLQQQHQRRTSSSSSTSYNNNSRPHDLADLSVYNNGKSHDLTDLSSLTSSSLNTTVVAAKLEVLDR